MDAYISSVSKLLSELDPPYIVVTLALFVVLYALFVVAKALEKVK